MMTSRPLEIAKRSDGMKGFVVLRFRRWAELPPRRRLRAMSAFCTILDGIAGITWWIAAARFVVMKQFLYWFLLCAVSLALSPIEGKCASPEESSNENTDESREVTRKFVDVLQNGTWCHQSRSPVGFALNYFDFEGSKFRIDIKYVSDEGTIMRTSTFLGSWSLTLSGDNVAKIHFEVTEASDPDAARPEDLNLRLIGDDKLEYSNGGKLKLQSRGSTELCF
jgi:hypothetical protein